MKNLENRMPPDLITHETFLHSLSLKSVAKALANELLKTKPLLDLATKRANYCLGVHVRHVFDTGAPTVHVESSNPRRAEEILVSNKGRGSQTLNHVLDSLLGTSTHGRSHDLAAFVKVTFLPGTPDPCGHPFDCEPPRILDASFMKAFSSFSGSRKTCAAFCYLSIIGKHSPDRDNSLAQERELDPVDYYCGSTKFCDQLQIPVAPLALSSVWRAVIQLGQYAGEGNFGNETATFLLRGSDPFGFVVGFTIICQAQSAVKPEVLAPCFEVLHGCHAKLNRTKCTLPFSPKVERVRCEVVLNTIEQYAGMCLKSGTEPHVVPSGVIDTILANVVSDCPSKNTRKRFTFVDDDTGIRSSLSAFIYLASQFCDEKIEGKELCFGLVHGSPYLMFHWDGPSPIPLAVGRKFIKFADLPKQFHLIEDPEDRCLVLPFLPPTENANHPESKAPDGYAVDVGSLIPAYALELRHFKQAFAETDEIQLWSEEFRPYAYFTHRHPWAVACVVGPHSEMRVFTRGSLVAYRDGKGWKSICDAEHKKSQGKHIARVQDSQPWSRIASANKKWIPRMPVLQHLIGLAIQLSPIANRNAKGGLLFYVPKDFPLKRATSKRGQRIAPNLWYDTNGNRLLQDLKPLEPDNLPGERGRAWLRDQRLLVRRLEKSGQELWVLDEEVAHQLLRACKQDGGAIISGEEGVVQGFAKRVNPPSTTEGQGGTKRTTVKDYVNLTINSGLLTDEEKGLGLGVAVSSDGGITIAYATRKRNGAWQGKSMVLFNAL